MWQLMVRHGTFELPIQPTHRLKVQFLLLFGAIWQLLHPLTADQTCSTEYAFSTSHLYLNTVLCRHIISGAHLNLFSIYIFSNTCTYKIYCI